MSITFSTHGVVIKRLVRHLSLMVSQCMSRRSTCKIAVEVDGTLLSKLESGDFKPRQHPGIVKANRLDLPNYIQKALVRVVGDHPVKTLLNDCKRLNRYINARHPPAENEEVSKRTREIIELIDRRMSPEKLAALSEEAGAQWRRKREQAIKRKLGQNIYSWKPIEYGSYEALVYAVGRGAQEYGILVRILREVMARDEAFMPRSYFDFGSGVGSGMWAASTLWHDSIYEYYNVDSSRAMNDLSELILCGGNENQQITLRNVYYRQFLPGIETKYNLVISSYSLFELPSAVARRNVLLNLWSKCDGYLILVEEGTRRGSELIIEARDYLLSLGHNNKEHVGHVFAPCPHNSVCPRFADIADRTPCNFELDYVPLKIGSNSSGLLPVRYSYVVLKKGEDTQDSTRNWPRLVRPTLVRSKHVVCRLCTDNANLQEIIFTAAKHGKSAYRCARVSRWGDRLPIKIGESFKTSVRDRTRRSANTPLEDGSDHDEVEEIVPTIKSERLKSAIGPLNTK